MTYNNVVSGLFISRPNRFIALVEIEGVVHTVHVKNTGRCKELLVPNCVVYLEKSDNPNRKTAYDLIAVEKLRDNSTPLLINMDSQVPNYCVEEWLPNSNLFSKNAKFRREVKYKNSRFDFYVEDGDRKVFIEVKGCTLEQDSVALFPDAPTIRGVKHLNELIDSVKNGYEAFVIFVIQMNEANSFRPNDQTHKEFGDALRKAQKSGVKVLAYTCNVTPDSISINKKTEI